MLERHPLPQPEDFMRASTARQVSAPSNTKQRRSIGPRRNPASADAILDAAEAILSEAGYAGFTVEAVARRAGAGKPTIYRWWSTKAALLLDVYGRCKRELPDPDTGSLEGDFTCLIDSLWRFWRETSAGNVLRSLIAEAQSDPVSFEVLGKYLEERRFHIATFVTRAKQRGEIPSDSDEQLIADIFGNFVRGRLLSGNIKDDKATIARAARLLVNGARGA
jgi:AcrR family transcriptional regulator